MTNDGAVNQNVLREIINYASAKLYTCYGYVERFNEQSTTTLESKDRYGNRIEIVFKTHVK